MIEKIISIKNVGRLRDYSHRGDVAFRKLNLVFADNGRGKTTLCAVLRSLQSGQAEPIKERSTLGVKDLPSVQIRARGNNHTFSKNVWSAPFEDIAIFDSVFVHDNVFAGDYVDSEHKKNLYKVIVGAQGVSLAKQIESLDTQIRDANSKITEKKEALLKLVPKGISVEAFIALQQIQDVDAKIKAKKEKIQGKKKTAEKATEIKAKGEFKKVTLPKFPTAVLSVLKQEITDILVDAETKVRKQIADHKMGKQGEAWLSQGVSYTHEEKCPFCGQSVDQNVLITAYRSHFNRAYETLKISVAQLSNQIEASIGAASLKPSENAVATNLVLTEFWKQLFEVNLPAFPINEVLGNFESLKKATLLLAQKKQESLITSVVPDSAFLKLLTLIDGYQKIVDSYNTSVDSCNVLVASQKKMAAQGSDIASLNKELFELEAKKTRFESGAVTACQNYSAAVFNKSTFEKQKETSKKQLDTYCQNILQFYETAINTYFDLFNTGFRIVNTKHDYRGGPPRSTFQIQINNIPVDVGDQKTSPGTPSFKTTLSAGDRNALALAFFMAAVEKDPKIAQKVVVLDDPFTSLDRFRRNCTQQIIGELAKKVRQVFVLSHDPMFLKLLFDECPGADIKTIQLCPSGKQTTITEWDIIEETESIYLQNHRTLLNFYQTQNGDHTNVARSIRPFLEGMLRVHFPGQFPANEWLGGFIEKIRNSDPDSGLQHALPDLPELGAINGYSKKFHHDQNPNADAEKINLDELLGYVKRVLRLVGHSET